MPCCAPIENENGAWCVVRWCAPPVDEQVIGSPFTSFLMTVLPSTI